VLFLDHDTIFFFLIQDLDIFQKIKFDVFLRKKAKWSIYSSGMIKYPIFP